MIRVMIVDDEHAVRMLIKKLVNWDELGAYVAGEAESGVEAINIIDDVRPDIALVDIRMPFMDGLGFAQYMHENYPDLRIIIISAYQDFEYASNCIGLGLARYLLKPISKKELTDTLRDTISGINERTEEEQGTRPSLTVNQYVSFIEQNYSDPQINLTYIARKFGFNAAYFSRKFKEKTGKSFIEYLTAYRMEKACSLAKEGLLMYQTGEMVGIPDAAYFGKCFKKYIGITYKEYSKQFQ